MYCWRDNRNHAVIQFFLSTCFVLSLNTHESSKQHFLSLCDTTPSTELLYISNVVLQYHPIRMDTNIVCVKFLLGCQQCIELCIQMILTCVFRTAVLLLDEIMYMTIIVDVDHLVQWGYSGFREPLESNSIVASV